MRIIYGYSNCTDKTYNRIMSESNSAALVPDQKYHGLLIKGLVKNGAEIRAYSGLPINRAVTSRKLVSEPDEKEGSASFHYITTVNLPVLRQLMIFFGTFFGILKEKKDGDTFVICDCLNLANLYGLVYACKLKKIPVSLIVTDLPDMERKSGLMKKVNNRVFKKADSFILLTEQMNNRINKKRKPYIVLEGHVDSEAPERNILETYEKQNGKKIVLYAGSLKRIYGIGSLVKGFISADIPDSELWIYGDGDFKDELVELAKAHPSVKYNGIKSNFIIVEEEQKSALLVNPRPTAPEYTKYSFPSKNMEYMVSGTPVLTTKLPGMPREYYPYVYLIEEDSEFGISSALKSIFSKPVSERTAMGEAAERFVKTNKTNVIQAKKIMDFLSGQAKN